MLARRSPLTRVPGAALIALTLLALACGPGQEPTAPVVMAKAGNGNPTVGSVVPDNSKRGVTLDVTVNGSGFDQGSTVRFERQGVPATGVVTNSTSFVSPRKLIANITIAATADTGKYDVAVTTSGGRKGVGIELFTVEYELAELGIIGGTWSRANAINDLAEVVGESCTVDCLATAFYWSETAGLVDLGELPSYSRSGAHAINNRGQVFGRVQCFADDPGCGGVHREQLVRWDRVGSSWTITPMQGCAVQNLPGLDGERFLINNNDQCVARTSGFGLLVQTISGGAVVNQTALPPLHPGWYSLATAISDAPMVAGVAAEILELIGETGARLGWPEPVVWYRHAAGGWMVLALGIPSGDVRAYATDIAGPDAAGRVWVTGYTENSSNSWRTASLRAVRWTLRTDGLGGWQVVSTEILGGEQNGRALKVWAHGVNRAGEVVGITGEYVETSAPYKWRLGSGLEALPLPPGGAQGRAADINNQGWIAGAVWDQGNGCNRAAIWRLKEP